VPKPSWIATLSVALLLLGGCGGDEEPEPRAEESSTTTSTPSSPSSDVASPTESKTPSTSARPDDETESSPVEELPPEPLGECPMLADAAVTKAFGRAMGVLTANPEMCVFTPTKGMTDSSVTVNLASGGDAAAARSKCKGKVTDVEAGDDAFACVAGSGVQGYVFDGGSNVVLDVVFGTNEQALKAAAQLLPSVTFQS
jgi:hypothetical protein